MAYNGPIRPVMIKNDQLWSRISSMEFPPVLAVLINFGKVCLAMHGTLRQVWINVV